MRETMKGKLSAYSIAAGAAAIGIASVAQGQVVAGVVGDGVYFQFGAETDTGTFLGVSGGSYSPGYDTANLEAAGLAPIPSGNLGSNIVMVNPYTGELKTNVPAEHQVLGELLTGDVGGVPTTTGGISTMVAPADYNQDALYFTSELFLDNKGDAADGFFVNTSSDGGLLPMKLNYGDEVRPYSGETETLQVIDEFGDPVWLMEGGVIVPDVNGDPIPVMETHYVDEGNHWGNPADDENDIDFVGRELMNSYNGYSIVSPYGSWTWGGDGFVGFEMDGYMGWADIDMSGGRNIMRIDSLYFDIPLASSRIGDFVGTGDTVDLDDINAMVAAILSGENLAAFDLTGDGLVTKADLDKLILDYVDTSLTTHVEGTDVWDFTGTFLADFNLDGQVSILDLGILGDGYNQAGSWATGDANGDGAVDILDLGVLGDNYNLAKPGAGIPEPATMVLLGVGAAGLLARRRRNK